MKLSKELLVKAKTATSVEELLEMASAEAVAAGKPVVALESTILSHGMPYPQNYEFAKGIEKIIRDLGAVPATMARMTAICWKSFSPK